MSTFCIETYGGTTLAYVVAPDSQMALVRWVLLGGLRENDDVVWARLRVTEVR